jgi:hypothetical protein
MISTERYCIQISRCSIKTTVTGRERRLRDEFCSLESTSGHTYYGLKCRIPAIALVTMNAAFKVHL